MTRYLRLLAALSIVTVHISCLPTLNGYDIDLSGQQVRLTILHTSDIHSRLLPYDFNPLKTDVDLGLIPEAGPYGGAARMATLVKRERLKSNRVLHLDSGDSFQGAPIFNVNLGEVEYKFMSLMGVDAAVIGNHEFDAGPFNFTKQARDAARFPILAANYSWEDWTNPGSNQTALVTTPYSIRNVQGLKVAIIGLANVSSLNSLIERPNSLQARPLEQNEAVRGFVEFLRPSVDLVLLTSHAGLTEDQELIEGYEAYYEWRIAKKFVNREHAKWVVHEWFGPENVDDSVVRVTVPGVEGVDAILGGHLHIVLNPPQSLTDPTGRKVILSHGGAFSKYLNRLDLLIQMPQKSVGDRSNAGEIISHEFKIFPIDSLWCSDAMHSLYTSQFWSPGEFIRDQRVVDALKLCDQSEDRLTTALLEPYIVGLDSRLALTSLFAYAPRDIARRNNSTGGDSPLGNITADSMRRRNGVEAEVAITNSLGIRDNLYAGPLTTEAMFNVFPFENTVNVMFLSGRELQELFDFIAERSTGRGCASQAQVSGARFTMDCAQAQLNALRMPCDPNGDASDCPSGDRTNGRFPWQCLPDETNPEVGRCWAHPATNVTVTDKVIDPNATYRIAVNDYIARGGSGFLVLKRNTTRVETGIPLRDSLIGYMQNFCTCEDILKSSKDQFGNIVGARGQPCGARDPQTPSVFTIDPLELQYCQSAKEFQQALELDRSGCTCSQAFRGNTKACATGDLEDRKKACRDALPAGPALGRCSCREALAQDPVCGFVTTPVRNFCENPTLVPVALGAEDGRILRRVK